MKNSMIVGIVMLGLGFAIGWVAKPVPVSKERPVAEKSVPKSDGPVSRTSIDETAPVRGKSSERPRVVKSPEGPTTEQMAQGIKMQAEMAKAMVKRLRTKFEQHIDKLAENLNLTPAQKSALMASLEERIKKLDAMDFSDPKSMERMNETVKGLTKEAIETDLTPSLSEDQKIALADFKEREHQGAVDTLALKNLSKLQGLIEFEDGQRDEVYKILVQQAEINAAEKEEAQNFTQMFTEGMGIEMDPYDLGINMGMLEPSAMTGTGGEPKEIAKNIREKIDQRIEQRVEALRPVLNEKQLDQYRTELQTKGLGIMGPALNAMEAQGK